MAKGPLKGFELTPEKIDDIKLIELIERFNLLVKDFTKEGYVLQPFCQSGIRIVKIKKKKFHLPKGFKR